MKTLSLILLLITPLSALTQINKGMFLIEGSGSYSRSDDQTDFEYNGTVATADDTFTSAAFRAGVGVFVSSSLMIGGGFQYNHSASETSGFLPSTGSIEVHEANTNIYYMNLNARKFMPLADKLYFTVTGNFNFGKGKTEYGFQDEGLTEADLTTYQITVTPGAAYFVNNRFAVTASVGSLYYYSEKLKPDTGPRLETRETNYGLSLHFNTFGVGVQYYMGKNE